MTDESNADKESQGGVTDEAGADSTDLTGGRMSEKGGDTGVSETGDISGATSTHAGAGGVFDNTGGTGTAPTE